MPPETEATYEHYAAASQSWIDVMETFTDAELNDAWERSAILLEDMDRFPLGASTRDSLCACRVATAFVLEKRGLPMG